MAYLNVKDRVLEVKIVYYGASLSGKTSNLELIKQRTPECRCSEMISLDAVSDRAFYFEWLPSYLGKVNGCDVKVQLHTIRGEVQSKESWRRVLTGADGVVFVLDSQPSALDRSREALTGLQEHLRRNNLSLDRAPIVVQINKRDLSLTTPEELLHTLGLDGLDAIEAVATTGQGVFETLREVTRLVLRSVKEEARRSGDASAIEGHALYPSKMSSRDPLLGLPPPSRPLSGIRAIGGSPGLVALLEEPLEGTFAARATGSLSASSNLFSSTSQDFHSPRRPYTIMSNEAPKLESPLRLASARPEVPRTVLDEILGAIRDQNRRVDVIEPTLQRLSSILADQERRLVSRVSELIDAKTGNQAKASPEPRFDKLDKSSLEQRLDAIATRVESIEARLDERLGAMDTKVDGRFAAIIGKMDLRLSSIEETVDQGISSTTASLASGTMLLEQSLNERLCSLEERQTHSLIELVSQLSQQSPLSLPSPATDSSSDLQLQTSLAGLSQQLESLRQQVALFSERPVAENHPATQPEPLLDERLSALTEHLAPLTSRLDALDARLEPLLASLRERPESEVNFTPLANRFDTLDGQLGTLTDRLDTLDSHLAPLTDRFDTLDSHLAPLGGQLNAIDERLAPLTDRLDTLDKSLAPLAVLGEQLGTLDKSLAPLGALSERLDTIDETLAPLSKRLNAIDESVSPLGPQLMVAEQRILDASDGLSSRLGPLASSIEAQRRTIEGQRGTIDLLENRVSELAQGIERKVEAVLFGLVDVESRNQDVVTSLGSLNAKFQGTQEQIDTLSTTLTDRMEEMTLIVSTSDQAITKTLDTRLAHLSGTSLQASDLEDLIERLLAAVSSELRGAEASTLGALANEHETTRATLNKTLDDTRQLVLQARAELLHQSAGQEARISSYSAKLDGSLGKVSEGIQLVDGSVNEVHQKLREHIDNAVTALHHATREHMEAIVGNAHKATRAYVSAASAEVPEATARQFNLAHLALSKSLNDIRGTCGVTQAAVKDMKSTLGLVNESPITEQLTALEQSVRDLWNQTHHHFEVVDTQLQQVNDILTRATSPDTKKGWWRP